QRRAGPAQRAAHRADERLKAVSARAIQWSFWVLLFGVVISLANLSQVGLALPGVVLTLILTFGVFFGRITKDEIDTARLEALADD
ncbi:MAG: hypothetical protein AAF311_17835, partial [Pseudomonadota bacterium]